MSCAGNLRVSPVCLHTLPYSCGQRKPLFILQVQWQQRLRASLVQCFSYLFDIPYILIEGWRAGRKFGGGQVKSWIKPIRCIYVTHSWRCHHHLIFKMYIRLSPPAFLDPILITLPHHTDSPKLVGMGVQFEIHWLVMSPSFKKSFGPIGIAKS